MDLDRQFYVFNGREVKMLNRLMKMLLIFSISFLIAAPSFAHVPYIEFWDYSEHWPFRPRHTIDQSIAVYAWLQEDDTGYSEDIDVYAFEIDEPSRIYLELLVPVCAGYEEFVPWFALVGPELPEPEEPLPFDLPPGFGAVVLPNVEPGDPRDTFYEPFGGKSYYQGPVYDEVIELPGTYYAVYWDPYLTGGDYVAVIGWKEIWRPRDIIRGLILTPFIRQDRELHTDCFD
jgi:hypothetical protein